MVPSHQEVFLRYYVLHVLDKLEPLDQKKLQDLGLHAINDREAEHWSLTVKSQLGLSETIDLSIWNLWVRNRLITEREGLDYSAVHFAEDFSANYYKEGSRVDTWEEGQIEEAQALVRAFKETRLKQG